MYSAKVGHHVLPFAAAVGALVLALSCAPPALAAAPPTTPIPSWVPVVIDHPTPATGVLPPDMWLGRSGHGRGPVITPAEAQLVFESAWSLRFQAFHDSNRSVMAAFETGPALESDEVSCGCTFRAVRPNILRSRMLVPIQRSYPAVFLAEATTTLNGAPYTQYLVLRRASAVTPWMVVADPGDPGARALDSPRPGRHGFDWGRAPAPTSALPDALASYWQSWADAGHAPQTSPFASGSETTGQGRSLAQTPTGSLVAFNGMIGDYRFQAGGRNEVWAFNTAHGSIACGVVRRQTTWSGIGGGAWQPPAQSNWGATVPPGMYRDVVSTDIEQPCFIERSGSAVTVTSATFDPDTNQGEGLGFTPIALPQPAQA